MSFAGSDMERRDNLEKFLCFVREEALKGIVVTEPFNKKDPFYIKEKYDKIIVTFVGDEKKDKACESFAKEFVKEDTVVDFVYPKMLKLNEDPQPSKNFIEGFKSDIEYKTLKTVSVRHVAPFLRDYIKRSGGDMVIIPVMEEDEDLMVTMVTDPVCTTCFVR